MERRVIIHTISILPFAGASIHSIPLQANAAAPKRRSALVPGIMAGNHNPLLKIAKGPPGAITSENLCIRDHSSDHISWETNKTTRVAVCKLQSGKGRMVVKRIKEELTKALS